MIYLFNFFITHSIGKGLKQITNNNHENKLILMNYNKIKILNYEN